MINAAYTIKFRFDFCHTNQRLVLSSDHRVFNQEEPIKIELEWERPTETFGAIIGYRLRYGIKNQTLKEEFIEGDETRRFRIEDLGKWNNKQAE